MQIDILFQIGNFSLLHRGAALFIWTNFFTRRILIFILIVLGGFSFTLVFMVLMWRLCFAVPHQNLRLRHSCLRLTHFLACKKIIDFELSPDKVSIITDFVDNLPPKSSSDDAFYQHRVVAWTNIHFIGVGNLILQPDIQPIAEINFPEKILIVLKPDLERNFWASLVRICHPKNKIFLSGRWYPFRGHIFLYFLLICFLSFLVELANFQGAALFDEWRACPIFRLNFLQDIDLIFFNFGDVG